MSLFHRFRDVVVVFLSRFLHCLRPTHFSLDLSAFCTRPPFTDELLYVAHDRVELHRRWSVRGLRVDQVIVELFAHLLESPLILHVFDTNEVVSCGPMRTFKAAILLMVSSLVWYLVSYSSTFVPHIGRHNLSCSLVWTDSGFKTRWYATVRSMSRMGSHSRLSLSHTAYPSIVAVLTRLCAGPVVVACREKYNRSRISRSFSDLILTKSCKISRPLSVNDAAHTLTRLLLR